MSKLLRIVTAFMIAGLVTIGLCACGDFTGTEGDPSKATLAMVYTMDDKNQTVIQWLDDDLNVVATSKYPYSGAMVSFENAKHQDGKLYLVPAGTFDKKDENDVVIVDSRTGEYESIELKSSNHVANDVENNKWVVSGNLNGEGYIDLIDLDSKTYDSNVNSEFWDSGIMQVALVDGKVYGVGSDENTGESKIYGFDADNDTLIIAYDLPDDPEMHTPTYLERHGKDLAFISDGKLVKHNTESGETSEVKLSRSDADILNINGDLAWIAYTDVHSDEYNTLIEVRDYNTGKVIAQSKCDYGVVQLEPGEKAVYIAGYEKMTRFLFDGKELTFDRDIEYDPEYSEFSNGGIYVID